MGKLHLIKTEIDRLPIPAKGTRKEYFDTELPSFGLRVTDKNKVYFVMSRVGGKLSRVTIGKHGVITPDAARKEAREHLVNMGKGVDVNRQKAAERVKGITLAKAMEDYFTSKPLLRPGTVRTYKCLLENWLGDWQKKPLDQITKTDITRRHLKIAGSDDCGEVTANNVMRTFRAIYNHAQAISDDALPPNPVRVLGTSRQWFRVDRRQTVIQEHELKPWHDAVMVLDSPVARDALLLLLLTGCREKEILCLSWDEVDMQAKTITIPGERTKNHRPHTLPMSDKIFEIMNQRLALKEGLWVFPGISKTGHIVEIKRAVDKVVKVSGVQFCLHDLRRTFSTLADQLCTRAEVDRLTNHVNPGDMTGGYIIYPVEQLRAPMQKITDRIMKAGKGKEATAGNVVRLRA